MDQLYTPREVLDTTAQTELPELETCLFPILDDGIKGDKEPQYFELDGRTIHAAYSFCKENNITLSTLLAATWSIVLHRYAETSLVCFGVKAVAAKFPLEEALTSNVLNGNLKICKISVNAETHIKELLVLEQNHVEDVCFMSECHNRINSALLFRGQPVFDEKVNMDNGWDLSRSEEVMEVSSRFDTSTE